MEYFEAVYRRNLVDISNVAYRGEIGAIDLVTPWCTVEKKLGT